MERFEMINYSLRNLWHRKTRNSLTILSILVGIATIFIFISFGMGLYDYVQDAVLDSSADKLIVQARGVGAPGLDTTFKLEDKDLKEIRKTPGVLEASGSYFKVAKIESRKEFVYAYLIAYNPENSLIMEIFGIDISEGRELRKGDSKGVVLGSNYKIPNKIFSKPIGLNQKIEVQGVSLKVVGFYEPVGNPQDDSNIYISENYLDKLYPDENNSYGWIVARINPLNIDSVIERLEKNLRKVRDLKEGKEDFFVQSFQEMMSSYMDSLNIIIGFIILIALVSVFVSAVNTANTMITSVLERIKEIGVIKSIGARNSEIFSIFLFESSLLGLIAGVLGVFMGWGIANFGGIFLENLGWGFLAPSFPPVLFAGCVLFAIITGAISGVFPAMKASKINVVDALRYE
jgi:putative ABC transport system permease protein